MFARVVRVLVVAGQLAAVGCGPVRHASLGSAAGAAAGASAGSAGSQGPVGAATAGETSAAGTTSPPDAAADRGDDAGSAVPVADAGSATADDAGSISGDAFDAPTPVGCVNDVRPGVHDFACDSTIHSVSIPEQCTRSACGVIVDVHGGMMSSQMQDKNTNLRELGRQHGYIVIQPNAEQNPLLLDQRLFVADTDDTRVMNILMQVIEAFHADRTRIHMTGFSEGGFMTWRWFCAHSELLASVAPGAAAWQCGNLANAGLTPPEIGCELSQSQSQSQSTRSNIPVLYMQGMKDGLVDPICADSWVRSNLMTTLALGAGTVLSGDPSFKTADYVRTRYLDPNGVPFEYIQHQYSTDSAFLGVGIAGHCYPGSTDLTPTPPAQTLIAPDQLMSFGCTDQCAFDWGREVIAFFIAHPKRR